MAYCRTKEVAKDLLAQVAFPVVVCSAMVPPKELEPKKIFVMMPSGSGDEYKFQREEADFIYRDIICPAVRKVFGDPTKAESVEPNGAIIDDSFFISREIDKASTGAINKSIISNINDADYCIVDLTGHNPNVFFELGVRYTLKPRNTILLRQKDTKIPFDIAGYRAVTYNPQFGGVKTAVELLTQALQSCAAPTEKIDSPVFDAIPSLLGDRPDMRTSDGFNDSNVMPWQEFLAQCRKLESMLQEKVVTNAYKPDVIIGITNGGLIFAEILGRNLFHTSPLLSLWANRNSGSGKYFDNIYNHGVVDSIKKLFTDGICDILLLDDNVATGSTVQEALTFLRSGLPKAKISFLPVFTRNRKYLDAVGKGNLVWERPEFKDPPLDLNTLHTTARMFFPYQKDLREGVWKVDDEERSKNRRSDHS